MRRLARHLFTLCSALSLLLCVAVMVMWVRSYFRWDRGFVTAAAVEHAQRALDFGSEHGHVTITLTRQQGFSLGSRPRGAGVNLWATDLEGTPSPRTTLGFRADRGVTVRTWDRTTQTKPIDTKWTVVVPHGFPVLLTAILPAAWAGALLRRRRRKAHGLCLACGYDLRASSNRCPECGAAPTADEPSISSP